MFSKIFHYQLYFFFIESYLLINVESNDEIRFIPNIDIQWPILPKWITVNIFNFSSDFYYLLDVKPLKRTSNIQFDIFREDFVSIKVSIYLPILILSLSLSLSISASLSFSFFHSLCYCYSSILYLKIIF